MAVTLHRLRPGEEAILARVAPEVFDEAVDRDRLARYFAAPGHLMLLAREGDLVVGQCAAVVHHHPDKPTELYVDELGTASTHRRRGIGRALLAAMFEWGRELGCEEAWLGTELDNEPANRLYRGFAPAADEPMQLYAFRL
ncbi:MAG TPA: GNAT family N-acetyltransferase [Devosiaceae bacterium]|nr:GNAT family N-acetyltransferase [Devosiaceae bacterium]